MLPAPFLEVVKMNRPDAGFSLMELLVVLVLLALVLFIAIPGGVSFAQEYRLRGASVYMRGFIRQVRAQAAAKNTYVGIVFEEVDGQPEFTVHVDGNGNGIRRADIDAGIDKRIRDPWRLTSQFPGVRYGSPPQDLAPEFPALRIGRSQVLSFSPIGLSTSGTLFLSNELGSIYAIIVLGATGKVRVARYHGGRWEPIS